MNLLQNRSVKKLSKEELIQDYVFDQDFAYKMMRFYRQAKTSQSLQEFLCDYLNDEYFQECERLYDEKSLCGEDDNETLWDEVYSDDPLTMNTKKQEINKRSNVNYDLKGFFKMDDVLYYITKEIAYDLTDVPFECVVASSVYYALKSDDSEFHFAWESALDFLLHPRFHKELRELLKNGDFVQKSRKRMLSGFRQALQRKQKYKILSLPPEIYNFDIIFAFLQFIGIDDQKAHELAKYCVSTNSFQGVIDYLSHLLQLEKGVA